MAISLALQITAIAQHVRVLVCFTLLLWHLKLLIIHNSENFAKSYRYHLVLLARYFAFVHSCSRKTLASGNVFFVWFI